MTSKAISIWFSPKLTNLKPVDKAIIETGIIFWGFSDLNTPPEWEIAKRLNDWTIKIWDSSESNSSEFIALTSGTLNTGIPHGITRKNIKQVDVFIPNVGGIIALRQSFDAISHELCHMIVSILVDIKVLPPRWVRNYQDKLMRPGTSGNTETVIVHDRDYEDSNGIRPRKRFYRKNFKYQGKNIGPVELVGIDITDLINKTEII